ncbi:PD-(D/E)XK nuclease family protein [Krasilnikovia sp. M28-CT-15]|uniref:PD-(D/E)XK nuclease family protein n=1 Tax=Krasilnikovia sp. M28-CT-15 TaxID=3373540 RepID=UPI003875B7B7
MAELSDPGTPFDTGVRGASAILGGPPPFWSYSGLKELEACPHRYVLSRARYPEIWEGEGYPSLPSPASLFGDIVHDSLEVLVKALAKAGCGSLSADGAVNVLIGLGGISGVVRSVTERRLRRLDDNPRLSVDSMQRLTQRMEDRAEDARAQVQEFLCRMSFPANATTPPSTAETSPNSDGGPAFHRKAACEGTHPEITLAAEDLRLMGRIDLLTVAESGASIVDYKTGVPDPGHLEQVNLYALLWSLDRVVNPDHVPIAELTVAYPNHDVRLAADDIDDLAGLEMSVRVRIDAADKLARGVPPVARPAPEVCAYCPVKGLCATYWATALPDPAGLADGTWFDFEGVVGPANGVRSRWLLGPTGAKQLLLRTSPSAPALVEGDTVRLVGIRREVDPETAATVAVMVSATEVLTSVHRLRES